MNAPALIALPVDQLTVGQRYKLSPQYRTWRTFAKWEDLQPSVHTNYRWKRMVTATKPGRGSQLFSHMMDLDAVVYVEPTPPVEAMYRCDHGFTLNEGCDECDNHLPF